MMWDVAEIQNSEDKSEACRFIIETLPEWFGIEQANQFYISKISECDVFAVREEKTNRYIGLLALKYHFDKNAEIWWLGVHPDYHRQSVGRALFEVAREHSIRIGCIYMIVNTLSDQAKCEYYDRTREFYQNMGFEPLFNVHQNDPVNPMMWMLLSIGDRSA